MNKKYSTMKKIITLYLAICVALFITPSCKKKKGCMDSNSVNYDSSAQVDDGSCEYAGTGGNTMMVAFPQHHGVPIISKTVYVDSAYIKFNTQNYPGNTAASYDLVLPGNVGENHVHIPNMKPGKYYIFMTGYDSTINQRVTGGIPYTLTQTSGEVDFNVPVTE
jgi:hypothetical protein